MSFWDEYTVRWAWVCCFFLLFISLIAQSWLFFGLTVLIFLSSTVDTWMWWLPGVTRKERFPISLEGASQRKVRTESPDVWLAQSVRYFRELGFFAGDRDASDEAIAERIAEAHLRENGVPFDATVPGAYEEVLAADRDRVWRIHDAPEVTGESHVYVAVLQEWGRISAGAFQPEEITELWEGDGGPILLEFTHDRRRHMVEPEILDGDIDTGILGSINELIEGSGRQFERIIAGNRVYLICVTPEERRRLVTDRGMRFY